MTLLRRHLQLHPRAFAWLLAAALLVKLLVPAGYMPMAEAGVLRIAPCSGYGVEAPPMLGMPDMAGHHTPGQQHGSHDHDASSPCNFSALGGGALGGSEPPALAERLAFAGEAPASTERAFAPAVPAYLRPPLRGPPTI